MFDFGIVTAKPVFGFDTLWKIQLSGWGSFRFYSTIFERWMTI